MLERFNRLIDELVERVRAQPTYGWATVVSVSPLQIRYDGQTDPVVGAPSGDTAGLRVGDRVWCQRIHRRDIVLVNRGSGRPYAMAAGLNQINVSGAAGATVTVTFPVGRFAQRPIVTLGKHTDGGAKYVPYANGVTSTAMTLGVYSGDGSTGTATVFVSWQAVQMTPTSATG